MRTIKTRKKAEGMKALDKPVNLSKQMKDAYTRTKKGAEETQQSRHASPTEYASDHIQGTAQGVAREAAHLPNPLRKAQDNLACAKGHFEEVKRQMPKERNRAAEQAKKMASKARGNADQLRKTAGHAQKTASKAKAAVKDAKQTLKETRQAGRQTLRVVKRRTSIHSANGRSANPATGIPKSGGNVRPGYLNKGITQATHTGGCS